MNIVCNSPQFEVSSESSSYFNLRMPGTYMATPASTDDNNNKNSSNNNNNNNHNHNHQSSPNSSSSLSSASSSSSSSSLSYSSSSSTSNNPSGYFDVKPLSSPAQTPYSDVQTPYFDALTSPFINNNFNSLSNDDINSRHNQQIAFSSWLNSNNNNNGGGVFTSTLPLTPSLFPNTSTTSSSSSYFPFSASQLPSSTLPPPQPPSSSSSIPSSLTTSNCPSLSSSSSSSSSTSSSTFSASPTSLQKRHLLLKPSDTSLSNKRPNSMPSVSSFASNSPFQEFSSETVESLLQQFDQQQRKTILLLDIRPYSSFSNDRIKYSIHLCAPTTLIKRSAFTIDSLLATLVNDADRQIFREWRAYENIIIYDNDTTTLTENSPIFHICKKFILPAAAAATTGATADKDPKVKIGFLKGGFPSFSSKFPGSCEKVDSSNNNNNGTFPRRRLSLGRKPGPFTCPTPVTESSNVNHFFNNIRQNIEGVAITETIPIRIPTQNNISLDQSKLPPFIRDVAFKDNGRMKLAELFLEIETTEQNRLKSLMIKNSNIATLDDPYSISAGIEKGTKNRYNNIWPYDHARVKINECKEGDCDYVNASFLQAKGCKKRYIATQGPLPTTYEDFWKIVWEQNSRLIVMLTKEEEAGRIQCHRYWSESASNPRGYGPLNLTLISESPMQTTTNNCNVNENNNLKFPPIIDNTIIIRKFKLSHKNHPNIPPREVTQLHFLGWPDFGTPETPINILKLIDVANDLQIGAEVEAQRQHEQIGPMIVHCSAGCGRTGTFCTIDTVISILSSSSSNDYNDVKDIVQSTILNFREQRLSIVQNLRQFVFCYEAILWKLVGAI